MGEQTDRIAGRPTPAEGRPTGTRNGRGTVRRGDAKKALDAAVDRAGAALDDLRKKTTRS